MNNSWWGKPEYSGIKVLVLVVVIAVAGYFVYQSQHKDALSNTGAAGTLANSAGVTGSCMGVTLHPAIDTSFTATNVTHGDLGDTVALFKLYNDAPCVYNLKTLRFNFMPNVGSASAMAAYSAPVLKNIIVKVNGVAFGTPVSAPVGPAHVMNFTATSTVVIPASSLTNTIEVIADIDPLAPASDSFKVRMTGMTALNTFTTAVYNWLPTGIPVVSPLLTIL
jgi:hypothetical protein